MEIYGVHNGRLTCCKSDVGVCMFMVHDNGVQEIEKPFDVLNVPIIASGRPI